MSEDKEFHEMYDRLMSYENAVHEKNQKRIIQSIDMDIEL